MCVDQKYCGLASTIYHVYAVKIRIADDSVRKNDAKLILFCFFFFAREHSNHRVLITSRSRNVCPSPARTDSSLPRYRPASSGPVSWILDISL